MEKYLIQATIKMTIPLNKSGEVLAILRPVIELSRVDPGCLSCNIYADLQDKTGLLLEQLWSTEEDLARHIRSSEYHNLLLALELALKRPEIKFDTISGSTGIETIEKARCQER